MTTLLDRDGVRLEAIAGGLAVHGEVDFAVATALAAAGDDWLASRPAGEAVDFDLGGVDGVSSAALSVLLEWTRRVRATGLELRRVRLSPSLARLTRVAGIDRLLPVEQNA
jgi:phospholipid transport system transporter-binding protein